MQLRVRLPDHAAIEVERPHPVRGFEAQIVGQERKVVQIAGAQDDRVDLLRRAILEIGGLVLDLLQQRLLLPIRRPLESHRLRAVGTGDRFRAVLVALRADILGRVGTADDQDVLALELDRVAEIVAVQDAAVESLEARKFRDIGHREVSGADDDVVEILGRVGVVGEVVRGHGELARLLVSIRSCVRECGSGTTCARRLFRPGP